MQKVAAIIPAYNEAKTIGGVVRQIKSSPLIDEVIVVSDGSQDATATEARLAGADKVLEFPRRGGKGNALANGVKATIAPTIFFTDADLLGLKPEYLATIIKPVLEGKLAMNVGVRNRSFLGTWLAWRLPLIGGERALRREVFENIPEKYRQNFKVEIALNYYCRVNHLPVSQTLIRGLGLVRKIEKFGFLVGLWEYLKMSWEIFKAMVEVRMARREFVMKR